MAMEPWTKESWVKIRDAYLEAKKIKERRMAKGADMEIEFKQSERIALIDSATQLVASLANNTSHHSDIESETYRAALRFLKAQYEPTRLLPEISPTDIGCM